jgi:HEAT repeat protein
MCIPKLAERAAAFLKNAAGGAIAVLFVAAACVGLGCPLALDQAAAQSVADKPDQTPVQGTGSGVAVDVNLKSGRATWSGGGTPTWEVELTFANYESAPAAIGNATSVIEINESKGDTVGLFIFRDSKAPSAGSKQFEVRYGLNWGVVVGAGAPTPWPWGTAAGGLGATDAFKLLLSAPWVTGLSSGGYPVVQAKSRYTFSERIMAPLQLKSGRSLVVVVPPRVKNAAGQWTQPYFEFRPAPGNSYEPTFIAAGKGALVATPATLKPIYGDAAAPVWKRILALSVLAETSFQSASSDLLALAADGSAPEKLRFAAVLNLGTAAYKPAIPELARIFQSAQDTKLKAAILEALGDIGDGSAAPTIRAAIDDPDLRNLAIDNAAKLKDAEAVPKIVAMLATAKAERDQITAVRALGQIGSPDAWAAVVATARDRKASFQSRRVAMGAIGENRYAPGEAALIEVLATDPVPGMRGNAINALTAFTTEAAFGALKAAAVDGKDGTAGSAAAVLVRSDQATWRSAAIALAADPKAKGANDIIYALGQRKVVEAVPTLRIILADAARDAHTRISAFNAIKSIAGKPTSEDVAALWTTFPAVKKRYEAESLARQLVEAGFSDNSAVPLLVAGLDEDRNEGWFANVTLLRHLTKQDIGPKSAYEGSKATRRAELDRWRAWAATQPK